MMRDVKAEATLIQGERPALAFTGLLHRFLEHALHCEKRSMQLVLRFRQELPLSVSNMRMYQ